MKLPRKPLVWCVIAGAAVAAAGGRAVAQEPPASAAKPSAAQIEAGEPRADVAPTPEARPAATHGTASASTKRPAAADRLDLGTATVTGDREQPKVMYIVPWKRPEAGDLSGKPMHSLLDEVLAPVDRDEFKREVAYYGAIATDASQNGASPEGAPKPAPQGEK